MPHVRKSKLVEQRFAQFESYLVPDPIALAGSWRALLQNARQLHVDVGCGKGLWVTRAAAAHPNELFIGIDNDRMCLSFALERAANAGLRNVAFVLDGAEHVGEMFAPGEIDVLHANFPTPFPRKKEAAKRVICAERLMEYRGPLGSAGELHLKTDSQPLFDFTLEELERAGYRLRWSTRDLRDGPTQPVAEGEPGPDEADLIPSAYEEKLGAKGARVLALHASAGPAPVPFLPRDPIGLVHYLPADLESLDYAPHGMEDTVANLRNRARNAARRG